MIRKAQITDFKSINSLSIELGYKIPSVESACERFKNILDSKTDELFVFQEEELKGWIHLFIANRVASPSFIEIGGLVVSEQYRRKGIGKKLIDFSIKWAEERDMKLRVRCNSKREDSHKFYSAIGFNKTKEQYIFEYKLKYGVIN